MKALLIKEWKNNWYIFLLSLIFVTFIGVLIVFEFPHYQIISSSIKSIYPRMDNWNNFAKKVSEISPLLKDFPSYLYSEWLGYTYILFCSAFILPLYYAIIINEKILKTANYLFSTAISRQRIMLCKSLFGILFIFSLILITSLSIIPLSYLIRQRVPYYLLGICFLFNFFAFTALGSIALFVSVILPIKISKGSFIALTFISMLILGIMYISKWFMQVNLFDYAKTSIVTHHIQWLPLLLCTIIILVFHALSLYIIKRKSFN